MEALGAGPGFLGDGELWRTEEKAVRGLRPNVVAGLAPAEAEVKDEGSGLETDSSHEPLDAVQVLLGFREVEVWWTEGGSRSEAYVDSVGA